MDEYYTPFKVWQRISSLLTKWKRKKCYEAFYGEGHTRVWLENNGYTNILFKKGGDFFKDDDMLKECDFVLTNPPYSKKFETLERLVAFDKPFVLILPSNTIMTRTFRDIFKDKLSYLSYGLPDGRISFIKDGKITNKTTFCSCFVFYKMNLKKQVYYI